MLQVQNRTPFVAQLMAFPDETGIDTVFTVVKATFMLGQSFGVAEEQVSIALADEHYADPLTSSIRVPSDVSLIKPGTDVMLIGSAWSPNGAPVWQVDASISAGSLHKAIRVFGDRVWGAGGTIDFIAPFVRMPLVWERAYGGTDETPRGPATEPRNPVGVGFRASHGTKPVAGTSLPNIEDPAALISSPRDTPAPAGFAPVASHWMPRRSYAGTYDETWQQNRAPFLPSDFDSHYCNLAPPGLSSRRHLPGGELVEVRGVTPSGVLRFALPGFTVQTTYRLESGSEVRIAPLDTVLIEPDAARVVFIWRAALQCNKKVLKTREVIVDLIQAGAAVAE